MKNWSLLSVGLPFLFFLASLGASDARPRCFNQVERTFFETRVVMLSLGYYNVPQGIWNLIARDLASRNRDISSIMWQRGKKRRPNPLANPFNSREAANLLRSVTRDIFMEIMQKYQPVEQRDWGRIFDYIFDFESQRIEHCLRGV